MRAIKPKDTDKEYVFNITALIPNRPWRKIALLGRQNLYKFAESIVYSFNFCFDHCFGFYSKINTEFYHDSLRQYELFADLGDVEPTKAGSVKNTKISEVWENSGDKMTFLFDYGDGWRFLVELEEIKNVDKTKLYPVLL